MTTSGDDRPGASERYASAIRTGNLRSQPRTVQSDSDMLGAAAYAARAGRPLAIALERLFAGDDREHRNITGMLAHMAWGRARQERVRLLRVEADDMARKVLMWCRHRACQDCGGHGFRVVCGGLGSSRAVIGDEACTECTGAGRRPLEREFRVKHRTIAAWLVAEVEREQSFAGPAIMAALADRV